MSKRGMDFLEEWISDNIHAESYPEEGKPDSRVPPLVAMCLAKAEQQGISRKEIEEDAGPIEDRIGQALIDATDAEVARLASKDE